ncbi:MAG: hypothetical protein CSA32_00185 [Desulfobulbus propionicus]|nr:MAG: hypothetical protein CSA32_00185 [Desulfobulbus propionicus]
MSNFSAHFIIIEERNCPLYSVGEGFSLTDKTVELAPGRSSCLILLRELTGVLVKLIPSAATGFSAYRDTVFTCGGCTGLVKFKLTSSAKQITSDTSKQSQAIEVDNADAIMSGIIEHIMPAELLQFFHMHQKTGRLIFEFSEEKARVAFCDGSLLAARYGELDLHDAVYAILAEKRGRFCFVPGLPESVKGAKEMGDFMMILMEGLRRIDEEE